MAEEKVQFKMLLPAALKARLEEAAHDHRRSVSAEIISRLETTFEMDDYVPQENIHSDDVAGATAELKAMIKALYDKLP